MTVIRPPTKKCGLIFDNIPVYRPLRHARKTVDMVIFVYRAAASLSTLCICTEIGQSDPANVDSARVPRVSHPVVF